jgi:serine/threonine protein kinase
MPFKVGEIIDGRYEILEEIGAGGHGTVFRGKDVDLDSDVAIKVLHAEFAQDADFAKRAPWGSWRARAQCRSWRSTAPVRAASTW